MMSRPVNLQNTNEMPPQALLQMLTSYRVSQSIYVAAKLRIADLLNDGPRSSDELAKSSGSDSRALYRLLRMLASVGIFAEVDQGCFTLTPLAALLQTGAPGSLRAYAIMNGEDWFWRPWGELLYSVKTGKTAFDHVCGMGIFKYLAQHPEAAEIFNEAMTGFTLTSTAVVAAYDFSGINTLIDVGGGQGALLAAILKANPQLRGVLFDLPSVIEGAKSLIEAEGVAERCELVAGDFFESVPGGAVAYILKFVIHDWDDDRAVTILKNCHRAVVEDGKLLVVEMVIPPGNEPFYGKLADLNMLVLSGGGRERTEAEYRALFATAGFKLTKIIPTQSPTQFSVIEGVRA